MTTPSERLEEARAQRVRVAAAAHELKNARIALRDVLGNAQHVLGSASIEYVLRHVPGLGVKGTRKVLRESCKALYQKGRPSEIAMAYVAFPSRSSGAFTDAEVQAIWKCLPPRVHARQPKPRAAESTTQRTRAG